MNEPVVSVVIPTYAKAETLVQVIARLEEQDLPRQDFEVVVVDDGSPDDTARRMERVAAGSPLTLRYLRQANSGVSAARNRGVREARAPIILLLQDDILAIPSLLSRHVRGHRLHPETAATVSGRVTWPPTWAIDPFMEWIDHGGPQFKYDEILGKTTIDCRHFYACNVSLKRTALLENPFDEEVVYGWEDTELADRLEERGYTFYFDEQAVGYHHHRRGFGDFLKRQFAAGRSLYFARKNNPRFAAHLDVPRLSAARRARTVARGLLLPLYERMGARRPMQKFWRARLDAAVARGYHAAQRQDRRAGALPSSRSGPRLIV